MAKELFENIQAKKQKVANLIGKAKEYKWLTDNEVNEYKEKLDKDVLTIGVIGQMKAGKSTFLNAFVFEDDVLPAATTPMTAALSVITYGERKRLSAEFYTEDEWQEQLMTANTPIDNGMSDSQKSKIKAAKELVEKSEVIKGDIKNLLGKTVDDDFEKLIEYVGADGKYVSITKAVTIYYPQEYLKGVRIVDTPGFNDPIVSREERTKDFLKEADVVLLMLYANRAFDATDRDILFKNVAQCGMGKVLIGINKYDIPYGNGNSVSEIKNHVIEEIRKASVEMKNEQLNDILKDTEPIPLSAEMALLGYLPMSRVNNDDIYKEHWKKHCDDFEITSQSEMVEKSLISNLVNAVRNVIEKEKDAVLFKKPVNAILAKGDTIAAKTDSEILKNTELIKDLSRPDYELDDKKESLSKAKRRLEKKINGLGDDLDEVFEEIIRKGSNKLEDDVDSACKDMSRIVDEWGRFESQDKIRPRINDKISFLATRTLKRDVDEIQEEASRKVKKTLRDFFDDATDILSRLDLGEEFDPDGFVKQVSKKYQIDGPDNELFTMSDDDGEEHPFLDGVADFINGATFGLAGLLGNAFTHDETSAKIKSFIASIRNSFDAKGYLSHISDSKDKIIKSVSKEFVDNLLNPLIEQVELVTSQLSNREVAKKEAEGKLSILKEQKDKTKSQITEIQNMVHEI